MTDSQRTKAREKLARDMAEFLAQGGAITEVEAGKRNDPPVLPKTDYDEVKDDGEPEDS